MDILFKTAGGPGLMSDGLKKVAGAKEHTNSFSKTYIESAKQV